MCRVSAMWNLIVFLWKMELLAKIHVNHVTPINSQPASQEQGAGRSSQEPAGWLAGWLLAGWLASWLAWLANWLAGWLASRLAGWLVGWLAAGWLAGKLAGLVS